ncbi:unnamed protein product [Paramecium pentaurelia]|uniref:Uncharacterized protein n=1 Tax=Paramecium pentaurelia TaxID=43138 RepID=A0A8S1VY04_9CILI|nr:unnamed protein product [Paramecium pentaurelia]
MGACSGKQPQKKQVSQPKQIVQVQSSKQNFLAIWNDLNSCLNLVDKNVDNEKSIAKLKTLFQTKGTIEEMIVNQSKRGGRNVNQDPLQDTAFQYNLYLQVDKINRILSDYLLIDRAFEDKNSQLFDKLQQSVDNIEQYRQSIKTKQGIWKQNQSTNFSNTNVY